MTIDHASAVWQPRPFGWGPGPSSGAQIAGDQAAFRTARIFPVAPSVAGSSSPIFPYAVPWTRAADAWGVAYPAGTLGVTQVIALPNPLAGTLNDGFEAMWESLLADIFPVPGQLPVGYTPCLQDGWDSSADSFFAPRLARRRTANGYIDATWLPTLNPNGLSVGPVTLVGSGGTTGDPPGYMIWATDLSGFRKVQVKFQTGMQWLTMPTYDQICTFAHNADGSYPGTSALGDTTDATLHITDADFSDVDADYYWETDWLDVGPILASIGVLSTFQIQTDSSASPFNLLNGVTIRYRLSPRCDVPYPISVHGHGALIAPGGYP